MVAARIGEKPGGNRRAKVAVSEVNESGHAFRGIFFGVVLGAIVWAVVALALV